MTKKFKRIDDLFVGIRLNDKQGFVTPDGNDVAAKSRKETVKSWAGKFSNDFKIVKNEAIENFKIESFASRYSTSNKFIKIEDPRGWVIDVSIENFVDLAKYVTIEKGVIKEKLVYAREGSNNWLMLENDPRISDAKSKKETQYQCIGDHIENRNQYLGLISGNFVKVNYKKRQIEIEKFTNCHLYANLRNNSWYKKYEIRKNFMPGQITGNTTVSGLHLHENKENTVQFSNSSGYYFPEGTSEDKMLEPHRKTYIGYHGYPVVYK